MSTQRLYGQLAEKAGLMYLALGPPQLWVDGVSLDSLALGGQHAGWGYCWCQPRVETRLSHGHVHHRVTHRRVADMSDADFDRDHPEHGWAVDSDGSAYPAGSHP